MLRFITAAAIAIGVIATPVAAQDYPNKPIKMLVGYAPGGGSDIIARLLAQNLQVKLGQPVVVENRPGAGGNIAAGVVATARPDGYTLLMTPNTISMAPALYEKIAFDVAKDLAGVAIIANSPIVLIVHPTLPVNSIAELIQYAKTHPGKLSYSTPGVGTPQHLATELFKSMTASNIVHVPYKGGAPAVAAVVSGEIPLSFAAINSAKPFIDSGRVRAIAIGDATRSSQIALPTIGETVAGYDVSIWYGVMAPAGTPKPVLDRLNNELAVIVQLPEVKEQMARQGYENAVGPASKMNAQIRADLEKWGRVVKQAGIKPE